MSDNLKNPIADSLNRLAQKRIWDSLQNAGRSLPCTVTDVVGQIVTVAFNVDANLNLPLVTVPVATSLYDWLPIQVGDKGFTVSADVYIDNITGLGAGQTPSITRPANLAALVFVPLPNAAWTAPVLANQRTIQGPGGFVGRDTGNNVIMDGGTKDWSVTIPTDGTITLKLADASVQIALSANGIVLTIPSGKTVAVQGGDLTVTGNVTAGFGGVDSVTLQNHLHAGVTIGSDSTVAPTAGT